MAVSVDDLVADALRLVVDEDIEGAVDTVLDNASGAAIREIVRQWVINLARIKMRAATLDVERAAERIEDDEDEAQTPRLRPRRNTRAYDQWVETTDEGRAYEDERAAWEERWERKKWDTMSGLLADWKSALRIEWTSELLSSVIAMPDGTRTTWGAASIEQHQARAAMFEANAVANAEGAARHLLAVDELRSADAACLDDLVRAAV